LSISQEKGGPIEEGGEKKKKGSSSSPWKKGGRDHTTRSSTGREKERGAIGSLSLPPRERKKKGGPRVSVFFSSDLEKSKKKGREIPRQEKKKEQI